MGDTADRRRHRGYRCKRPSLNTVVAVAGAAVALILATWYGRSFIQVPVDHLLTVLNARRDGERDARIGHYGVSAEFDRIGHSVDSLFDELDRNEDEQKRLQQQRDIFARELQHRVKNLPAIIQVIANQTLSRRSEAPEVMAFEQRIHALIKANSTLLSDSGERGDFRDILNDSLGPFFDGEVGRLSLTGPRVLIGAKAGIALTLALHELATNAAKHGALSADGGRIAISRDVENGNFILSWAEEGGPEANAPAPPGFDTMMIKRAIEAQTKGHAKMTSAPQGVRFRLVAPLEVLSPAVESRVGDM